MTMSSIDRFENIAKNGEVHSLDGIPSTFYGDEMKYLRKKANDSFRYAESIQRSYELGNKGKHNVPYPENSPFTKSLSIISKLIKGDLGTKIYLVTLKGFDTHSNQNKRHPKLLKELSDAVMSFYADLAANNCYGRHRPRCARCIRGSRSLDLVSMYQTCNSERHLE